MSRKGENIFKRKDGRWEARYIKGRELSGRIRYGFCYGRTYREAKEKAAACRAAALSGAPAPVSGSGRFSVFCQEWLRLEREKVRDSTYDKYETVLNNHILPKLGDCRPAGITAEVAERFKRELLAEGLAPKTVRDDLAELRSILKYTASRLPGGLAEVAIAYPREQKREARVLSPEEQRRFVEYLRTDTDTCKFGVLLALYTGLRIGELCALRWGNISLRDRTLRVEAAMQRLRDREHAGGGRTRVVIGRPKSAASVRSIPLTDRAAGLCGQYDPHDPAAFILTGTEKYMEPRQLQRRLEKYTRECGLEGVHFHTIRHTFATRCVEAGFELKSLSEILGHSDTSVTLDRYVHSSMQLKRENMDKLSAAGM